MKYIAVVASILFIATLCGPFSAASAKESRFIVATTLVPVAEFIQQVGGDHIEVITMIPPGANPHVYDPVPGQFRKLAQADLYIMLGAELYFEKQWVHKFQELNPQMKVVSASEGVELLEHAQEDEPHHDEFVDPHIWLSPVNAIIMIDNIAQALSSFDPSHATIYQNNAQRYKEKLAQLNRDLKEKLSLLKNKSFMVFHPAWAYFAKEYGLTEHAIQHQGKSPRAQDLAHLIHEAEHNHINIIFISPQFNKKSAKLIAKQLHAAVRVIDPLAKDYISNLHSVADALRGSSREQETENSE